MLDSVIPNSAVQNAVSDLFLNTTCSTAKLADNVDKSERFKNLSPENDIEWAEVWTNLESLRHMLSGPGRISPRFCEAVLEIEECQRTLLQEAFPGSDALIESTISEQRNIAVTYSCFSFFAFEDAVEEIEDLQKDFSGITEPLAGNLKDFDKRLERILKAMKEGFDDYLHVPIDLARKYLGLAAPKKKSVEERAFPDFELIDAVIIGAAMPEQTSQLCSHYFDYVACDVKLSDRAKNILTPSQKFLLEIKESIVENFYSLHKDGQPLFVTIPDNIDRKYIHGMLTLLSRTSAQLKLGSETGTEQGNDPVVPGGLDIEFGDHTIVIKTKPAGFRVLDEIE